MFSFFAAVFNVLIAIGHIFNLIFKGVKSGFGKLIKYIGKE